MKKYLSIKRYGLEHFVALVCLSFLFFAIISCDSGGDDNGNGGNNPSPTPTASTSPSPSPSSTPTPSGSPSPSPEPISILEPGGTLSEDPETFDYVGDRNPRQALDFYEITGLESQAASIATRGIQGSRPAIVFFHGGAWVVGNKEDVLDEPIIFDAAEQGGFHVISVGYRLATEASWPAQIHDANDAIRWIKINSEMLGVDPDRLIIVGGSAGAHIGGAVAAASDIIGLQGDHNHVPPTSTDVALAVLIFGAYNMNMIVDDGLDLVADTTCGVEDLGPGLAAVLLLLDCPPSFNLLDPLDNCSQNALDSSSPELFVDSSDPPMYLAHGRDDCTVPYQQTLGMTDAVENAGLPFVEMIFEGGEHSVGSLDLSVEDILDFIDMNVSP